MCIRDSASARIQPQWSAAVGPQQPQSQVRVRSRAQAARQAPATTTSMASLGTSQGWWQAVALAAAAVQAHAVHGHARQIPQAPQAA
eukprot:4668333-Alexandrium_andersonii.AAC.1